MEWWTLAAHDDDHIVPHSVEERCSSLETNLAPLRVTVRSLGQHLAHLMDDEFQHLNTANRAHQHRIQNTPKNVFVEERHWLALSLMGDSMRHFPWGRRPDDWFVTDQHPRGIDSFD